MEIAARDSCDSSDDSADSEKEDSEDLSANVKNEVEKVENGLSFKGKDGTVWNKVMTMATPGHIQQQKIFKAK